MSEVDPSRFVRRKATALITLALLCAMPVLGGAASDGAPRPSIKAPAVLEGAAPMAPARVAAAVEIMRGERLDLASATPASLRLVPGIGSARAARLVAAVRAGEIRQPADLTSVEGIGPVLAARLLDHLRIEP